MTQFERFYRQHYQDEEFRKTYLTGRGHVYRSVVRILLRLGVRQVLDAGCSFGLLVERLNELGFDARGVDFPLPQLQEFHSGLTHSAGKFLYGDATQMQFSMQPEASAIVALDLLRHLEDPGALGRQGAEYLLVKERGAKSWVARNRSPEEQVRHYSPGDLLDCFPAYDAWEIHATRFLLRVGHPGRACLRLFDHMPSYTAVLKRRS